MIQHPKYEIFWCGIRFHQETERGMIPVLEVTRENGNIAVRVGKQVVRDKDRLVAECLLGRVLLPREMLYYKNGIRGDFENNNAIVVKANSQLFVPKRALKYGVTITTSQKSQEVANA